MGVDASTGFATYELTLPVKESSLGDDGSVETVIVETSFASYEIMLAPTKATSGIYEGTVAADQFGGVGLPVRFMVKTTPENIQNFDQQVRS